MQLRILVLRHLKSQPSKGNDIYLFSATEAKTACGASPPHFRFMQATSTFHVRGVSSVCPMNDQYLHYRFLFFTLHRQHKTLSARVIGPDARHTLTLHVRTVRTGVGIYLIRFRLGCPCCRALLDPQV